MSRYPQTLSAHLVREVTTVCHCWRLARTDGHVAGYTDHDRPLTVDGTPCAPHTGLAASEARDTLGLAVDTADVEGALSADDIADADIAAGLYDGATVETFLVNWRQPADVACLRKATIGKITRSDGRFVAELESVAHALDRPSGRYVSRLCDAELGDARCGFDLANPAFSGAGAVAALEAPSAVLVDGLDGFQAGWFTSGVLTWTSGPHAGRAERVEEHRTESDGTRLVLRPGAPTTAEVGAMFTIVAGCDKSFSTCKAKFANPLNFRGFPHLPGNDTAYGYVADGGRFDGGPVVP